MRAKDFHMKILHWVKGGLEQRVAWFESDFCVTIYKKKSAHKILLKVDDKILRI